MGEGWGRIMKSLAKGNKEEQRKKRWGTTRFPSTPKKKHYSLRQWKKLGGG